MLINAILAVLDMCGVTISSLQKASGILMQIALAIAIIITVLASYHVARSKGKKMFVLWLVSAILVVLSYVLGITLI